MTDNVKVATRNIETSSPPLPIMLPFFDPWLIELQQAELLEIPDLDFLPLKEEEKKDLAFVCAEYNRLLHNLAVFQRRHEAMVKGAMVYQTAIIHNAQEELRVVKSRVASVTDSARNNCATTSSRCESSSPTLAHCGSHISEPLPDPGHVINS